MKRTLISLAVAGAIEADWWNSETDYLLPEYWRALETAP